MKKVSAQELPKYFGELYLELHRGTYTTNHNLKMYNRRLEEALHDAELISVLCDDKDSKKLTDGLYDTLMLNQFHDILPGTCLAEATDIALAEQKAALRMQRHIFQVREESHISILCQIQEWRFCQQPTTVRPMRQLTEQELLRRINSTAFPMVKSLKTTVFLLLLTVMLSLLPHLKQQLKRV
jgi:hypothetical protein